MANELTNLLPEARKELIIREYRFRLGVVAALLLSLLVCVAAILLAPTYIFLVANANAKETRLTDIKASLSSGEEATLSKRLSVLSSNASSLISLSKTSSVSALVRSVLAVPRPGITLSGFTHTAATGKTNGTLTLSGIAATRDVLRNYQLALQGEPSISTAELPVSVYAKDSNIAFTITISLKP
jgi:Tfp pilus assembly protein PilN